jgi:hypothetical protein
MAMAMAIIRKIIEEMAIMSSNENQSAKKEM